MTQMLMEDLQSGLRKLPVITGAENEDESEKRWLCRGFIDSLLCNTF